MALSKPAGIDLGTTNSAIGVMNDTDTEIILPKDSMGVSTLPSCVWHDPRENKIVVGKLAFRRRGARPSPIVSIKRKMGTTLLTPLGKRNPFPGGIPEPLRSVLQETREQRLERHLARLEEDDPQKLNRANPPEMWVFDQEARLTAYLGTLEDEALRKKLQADPPLLWLPQEVSALILAEEQRLMTERLNAGGGRACQVDRAIVTIPAYFGEGQIDATREAGALAGLRVLELMQEPTAAAIYNCWKLNLQDGLFLVFDLGGGTFDVSIVRVTAGKPEVLGISGDHFLGGDDLDWELAQRIRERILEDDSSYDLNLDLNREEDRCIRNQLILLAEGVKKDLSRDGETLLRNTTITDKAGAAVAIEMMISRDDFEAWIAGTIAKCIPKCWEALALAKRKADVSLQNVDKIFLVGGATHVPLVPRVVRERFCQFEGARPYSPTEIDTYLADIKGDDQADAATLRALARAMMEAGERARCAEPIKNEPDLAVAMGATLKAATYGSVSGDADTGVTLALPGTRCTNSERTSIKGQVTARVSLAGAVARLTNEPLHVGAEVPLKDDGAFIFKRVPLQPRAHNRFEVCVLDAARQPIARDTIVIEHNPNLPPTPDEGGGETTLAKTFSIDVFQRGRIERLSLLQRGASLPAQTTVNLRVRDPNPGTADFRIYQGNRMIKNIVATLDGTLPPGTPIQFSLSVSEDHLIKCTYRIGDDPHAVPAVIEPPPPETPPSPTDVEQLNRVIRDELATKPIVAQQKFRIRVGKVNKRIEDARAADDGPRLIEHFDELKELQREITQPEPEMTPPWDDYEEHLGQCRQLLAAIEKQKPNYPVAESRKDLDKQRAAAQSAYGARDQQLYGEYWARLTASEDALRKAIRDVNPPPQLPPEEQAMRQVDELKEFAEALEERAANFAAQFLTRAQAPPPGVTADACRQSHQQCLRQKEKASGSLAELEKLRPQCDREPRRVLSECRRIGGELHACRGILVAKHEILTGRKGADDGGVPEGPG